MTHRRLKLTSPAMRGDDVARLQRLLQRNRFGGFRPGPADGVFGEQTAEAVRRAKYALGYPREDINAVAARRLVGLLTGDAELPEAWARRRRVRLSHAVERRRFGVRVVDYARSQVGTVERPPGSNRQPYGEHFGENGVPWCGLFVCKAWKVAGAPVTDGDALRWDYVPQLVADARARVRNVRTVPLSEARPGDAVALDFDGGVPDHVEIIDHIDAVGVIHTVGGNTAAEGTGGSDANGGGVWPRKRYSSQVAAVVRYDSPAPQTSGKG